jgi:UDP-N-acetylmuramate dehydrogenase
VADAVARNLTGIECLSGIPGTTGAAPMQNIGAYGQEIAETLVAVDCFDRVHGDRVTFERDACAFGYRTSRFKTTDRDRYVVLAVRLQLRPDTPPAPRYAELVARVGPGPADLPRVREAVLALRRGKSMVLDAADPNGRSAGSFFMNPVLSGEAFAALRARWEGDIPTYPAPGGVKVPAAWLVERAGFAKGYRKGGVGVSTRHALALVNLGGTTAELLALAEEIADGVWRRFGVRLEREPVVIGDATATPGANRAK